MYESKLFGDSCRNMNIAIFIVILISSGVCYVEEELSVTSNGAEAVTDTECGKVQGEIQEGVYVFKGIPYADPPVGKLRWKPPVPKSPKNANCWTGTFKALEFGNACFQNFTTLVGSEDCLYLNVWTPTLDKFSDLPVMVYIHGGNLQLLSGSWPGWSPNANVTSDTKVVHVSLNYRLNIFGFLALDLLTNNSTTNSSGNYGFMDQLLVLKWVQKNIRNFGGNPSLVTLFGQSSGGTSVLVHLASPLSHGLFHRAWLMSASAVLNKTLDQASKDNLIILSNTGCDDLDCLYNLSSEQLLSAIPVYEWPSWGMVDQMRIPTKGVFYGALAIIDGYVLKEEPLQVFRAGRGMNVPVIVGTTSQENDFFEEAPGIRTWTWVNYTERVTNKLKTFGDDIVNEALELYPTLQNNTPEFQLTSLSSDIRCTCPNHVFANALSSSSTLQVYRYVVTSHPTIPINIGNPFRPAYSFHSWDMIAFFYRMNQYFAQPSKENLDFKRILTQEIIYFARNGFPRSQNWKTYLQSTALISSDLDIVDAYHFKECQFWLNNGFLSYGWIN